MSFNFAPKGWAECNGQVMPINQNQALFSLLGTAYGGDGRTTFRLPELRGRIPVHFGGELAFTQGTVAGEEAHTLGQAEMPAHIHVANANTNAAPVVGGNIPGLNKRFAGSSGTPFWSAPNNLTPMDPQTITNVGGSQAHENRQPYMALEICIALQGIFPSQN
jgi:microcystin-dependent protein